MKWINLAAGVIALLCVFLPIPWPMRVLDLVVGFINLYIFIELTSYE